MTSRIPLNDFVLRSPGAVSCTLAGEEVILDAEAGVYYSLTGVGPRIWTLIGNPIPLSVVLQTLLEEYEVDRETCEADLMRIVHELEARNLIASRSATSLVGQGE